MKLSKEAEFLKEHFSIESIEDGYANDADNSDDIQMWMVEKWLQVYHQEKMKEEQERILGIIDEVKFMYDNNLRVSGTFAFAEIKKRIEE